METNIRKEIAALDAMIAFGMDLSRLLTYLWDDELRSYRAHPSKDHIHHSLQRLNLVLIRLLDHIGIEEASRLFEEPEDGPRPEGETFGPDDRSLDTIAWEILANEREDV